LELFDYNEHRKDSAMGFASFELSKLQEDADQENISLSIMKEGKDRGELRFDM
jgi:Ca2+-dependent lipid-binding protein